jgi:hypothetical protein
LNENPTLITEPFSEISKRDPESFSFEINPEDGRAVKISSHNRLRCNIPPQRVDTLNKTGKKRKKTSLKR